ncbi:MAG: hypothetical protein PHV30_05110 [Candidatus Margulisbacteria bacterium]|nr:hypothetical protein [Candidatus Margulisiibacteriota bacterium]
MNELQTKAQQIKNLWLQRYDNYNEMVPATKYLRDRAKMDKLFDYAANMNSNDILEPTEAILLDEYLKQQITWFGLQTYCSEYDLEKVKHRIEKTSEQLTEKNYKETCASLNESFNTKNSGRRPLPVIIDERCNYEDHTEYKRFHEVKLVGQYFLLQLEKNQDKYILLNHGPIRTKHFEHLERKFNISSETIMQELKDNQLICGNKIKDGIDIHSQNFRLNPFQNNHKLQREVLVVLKTFQKKYSIESFLEKSYEKPLNFGHKAGSQADSANLVHFYKTLQEFFHLSKGLVRCDTLELTAPCYPKVVVGENTLALISNILEQIKK